MFSPVTNLVHAVLTTANNCYHCYKKMLSLCILIARTEHIKLYIKNIQPARQQTNKQNITRREGLMSMCMSLNLNMSIMGYQQIVRL